MDNIYTRSFCIGMMILSCGAMLSGCSSEMKNTGAMHKNLGMLEDEHQPDRTMVQSVSKQKGPEPLPQEMAPWMKSGETKPSGMLQDDTSLELRGGDENARRKENRNNPVPMPEEPRP